MHNKRGEFLTKLVFIEGVSGVGKSTMVRMLSDELKAHGYYVKRYVEFDYTNPIDFYSTAYFSIDEYEMLIKKYISVTDEIKANTINAGKIKLVRYYNENTPLFEEPLLSELALREFCYKPSRLVTLDEYTCAYKNVWKNFNSDMDETYDYIIFDGSLLHHPINDMMRNYHVNDKQIVSHIEAILNSLGTRKRWIYYLKTDNIENQLKNARIARNQSVPTNQQIEFWENRYKKDMMVLRSIRENYQICDISHDNWDYVRMQMVKDLI